MAGIDKNSMGHTSGQLIFQNLQEAHDWLDAIIESSYDGIFITDGDAVTAVSYTHLTLPTT